MRRIGFVVAATTLAAPCFAHAQGYSVVGGGSTHSDAQPAPATTGTATPATSPNAPMATVTPAPRSSEHLSRATVTPTGESPSGRQPWDYAGLTPGGAGARIPGLSRRETGRAGQRAVVAWPGFQMTPNGSRVFVATTRAVTVSGPQHTPGRYTYVLGAAYIPLSNNRRPLDTSAFETPIDRAYVRQHGRDAELVIETRSDSAPQMTQQNASGNGLSYLFFDFGRWTPPDHVPRMLRDQPGNGRQPGVRLSPGQDTTAPATAPGDDETPPPVER